MFYKKQILPILLLICVSCNTDQETPIPIINTIHFNSQIHSLPTKSIITSETFPTNSRIGIYSWGHHKDDGNVNTTLRADLTNAIYTKEADNGKLQPTIEAHYPVTADTLLNFYSYYPYTEAATNPASIPFALNDQADIMWSTPVLNRGKASTEVSVNLEFNHLLSAITLKIQKADDTQEEMLLESISLENYAPTVRLDIQTGKLTQPAASTPFIIKEGINTPITTDTITIQTDYLLCPIDKPTFIIRMSNKEYKVQSSKAFLPGKKQTYEFTIQSKDIHITGQIKPWEDGGTSNEVIDF